MAAYVYFLIESKSTWSLNEGSGSKVHQILKTQNESVLIELIPMENTGKLQEIVLAEAIWLLKLKIWDLDEVTKRIREAVSK